MFSPGAFADKVSKICLHGHVVRNPYTLEKQYVPCGTCEACLYSRSVQNTLRVYAESQKSNYTYFVTLTFAQRFISKYKITKVKDVSPGVAVYCASASPRVPLYESYISSNGRKKQRLVRGLAMNHSFEYFFHAKDSYIEEYTRKANLGYRGKYPELEGYYSYLCREDVSLFMKRLRKLLQTETGQYEKIHAYVVGEYGPKTLRAHFHIILCFDSPQYGENIRECVCKAWKFGRSDVSLSRGKSEEYVAAYVNSTACTPYHLRQNNSTRPFGRFSNNFGNRFFSEAIREGREGNFTKLIDGECITLNGRSLRLYPWRSLIESSFYLPAVRRSQSWETLSHVISSVRNIFSRPGFNRTKFGCETASPLLIARRVYDYCMNRPLKVFSDTPLNYLFDYLRMRDSNGFLLDRDTFIGRFYTLFRSTRNFLLGYGYNIYQKYINCSDLRKLLINSINFFKARDYENLRNSFESCQSIESSSAYILIRQDEKSLERFRESEVGKLALDRIHKLSIQKIKHREINDLNSNLFVYD